MTPGSSTQGLSGFCFSNVGTRPLFTPCPSLLQAMTLPTQVFVPSSINYGEAELAN